MPGMPTMVQHNSVAIIDHAIYAGGHGSVIIGRVAAGCCRQGCCHPEGCTAPEPGCAGSVSASNPGSCGCCAGENADAASCWAWRRRSASILASSSAAILRCSASARRRSLASASAIARRWSASASSATLAARVQSGMPSNHTRVSAVSPVSSSCWALKGPACRSSMIIQYFIASPCVIMTWPFL